MRFLKLLRVFKVGRLRAKYEDIYYNEQMHLFQVFLKIFILMFYFAHFFACIFWLVGVNSL